MKKVTIGIIFLLTLCLMVPSNAGVKKLGQAGMTFLKIEPSAHSAAMGCASSGTLYNSSAMFSNVAMMAFVKGLDASVGQTNWIADITHMSGALAYGHSTWGTFGLSFIKMDYGTMVETFPWTDNSDLTKFTAGYYFGREFSPEEYSVGLSYARQISSSFAFGGSVKIVHQDLFESLMQHELLGDIVVDNKQTIRAFDFGTFYYTGFKDMRVTMSVRNFSNQAKYVTQRFELPLTMTIGTAMDVMQVFAPGEKQMKLTLAFDWLHPRDYEERVHLGAEWGFMDMLFLRAGYKFNYDVESFSGGLGVNKEFGNYGIRVDYAYSDFGDFFGAVHRMSLGLFMK